MSVSKCIPVALLFLYTSSMHTHFVWVRLPGRKNFSISPMEKSPFKLPMSPSRMTPRSRQLYSFGEAAVRLACTLKACVLDSVN